jgi:hypothetical protein
MMTEYRNRKTYFRLKFLGLAILFTLVALVMGWVVMILWNAVLPSAAHFGTLSYWQGVQLLILCRILFSGFGGGGWRRRKEAWRDKMENMTDEERTAFKAQWRRRRYE